MNKKEANLGFLSSMHSIATKPSAERGDDASNDIHLKIVALSLLRPPNDSIAPLSSRRSVPPLAIVLCQPSNNQAAIVRALLKCLEVPVDPDG
jgi:hypothetical protein